MSNMLPNNLLPNNLLTNNILPNKILPVITPEETIVVEPPKETKSKV